MIPFSPIEQATHEWALSVIKKYRALEIELIEVLQKVDALKLFKKLDKRSLFAYAVESLGLTESVAYSFISVARKSKECPELSSAIRDRTLSVSKASRIVSTITASNASDLIHFASTHTSKETEQEVARLNPKASRRDRIRPIDEGSFELRAKIPKEVRELLQRVQSLEVQKGNNPSMADLLKVSLECYLEKNDPVRKAKRVMKKKKLCLIRVQKTRPSRRLTAGQNHVVSARDEGKCTHIGLDGKRCNSDRWIEIHHIVPVSQGGSNDPSNLTTLCSFHHDLVHQLSLPLEGQVTWLRAPRTAYR